MAKVEVIGVVEVEEEHLHHAQVHLMAHQVPDIVYSVPGQVRILYTLAKNFVILVPLKFEPFTHTRPYISVANKKRNLVLQTRVQAALVSGVHLGVIQTHEEPWAAMVQILWHMGTRQWRTFQ